MTRVLIEALILNMLHCRKEIMQHTLHILIQDEQSQVLQSSFGPDRTNLKVAMRPADARRQQEVNS